MLRSLAMFCLFCADVMRTMASDCPITENIALNKNATQSSTFVGWGSGPAWKAVDGNADPMWGSFSCSHTLADANPWWKVDLGSVSKVARVLITNRKDCCADRLKNFKVEVGNSDTTMKLCGQQAESAGPGEEVTFVCPDGMAGQFVKVSLNYKNYLTLCEVKVSSF